MKLSKVLFGTKILNEKKLKNVNVLNVAFDTRQNLTGAIFVCLKGEHCDGHSFMKKAQNLGAVAFIVEEIDYDFDGYQLLVEDSRLALANICKNFYEYDNSLKVIAVTGTNGKTTTSYMVKSILESAKKKVCLIGTNGVFFGEEKIDLNMTTPDPTDLFYILSKAVKKGFEYVVMEVSAHSIYYKKINPINFAVKALTNITQDHLDFFKDMKTYTKTKVDFLKSGNCAKVVNIDTAVGKKLFKKGMLGFGIKNVSGDLFASDVSFDFSAYNLNFKNESFKVSTNVFGKYNLENMLCASLICKTLGFSNTDILNGLKNFKSVDGRLNILKNGNKYVVIDFAHTPDALEKIIKNVSMFCKGNLFCLFGCGGNRDKEKRSKMGYISTKLCKKVIFTSDNPRFENPMEIIKDIASGTKKKNFEIIEQRQLAIKRGVELLKENDFLLVCGKGSENYIEIMGNKYSYSDFEQVQEFGFVRVN